MKIQASRRGTENAHCVDITDGIEMRTVIRENIEDDHVYVSTKPDNSTTSANAACGKSFEFTEQDSQPDKTETKFYEIDKNICEENIKLNYSLDNPETNFYENDCQENEKTNSSPDKAETHFYENDRAENVLISSSADKTETHLNENDVDENEKLKSFQDGSEIHFYENVC
ncbi:unnamed protein product [Mytilus coruscus]|uniref:Uncharacterized protein n=1 Tax=Mytilus coruscus TaxID=42192 RepID=A0A6J8AI46_MYTCO|nr:unnamed protein product [Mytilus coruscus]